MFSKNKIIFTIASLFFLNACSITKSMWHTKSFDDKISGFFINKNENTIILIGENKYKDKGNFHYVIQNSQNNLAEISVSGKYSFKNFDVNNKIIAQYLASKETYKNFNKEIIKLDRTWSGTIINKPSVAANAVRVVATPYTIVLDIIISPYTAYKFFTKKDSAIEEKHDTIYN